MQTDDLIGREREWAALARAVAATAGGRGGCVVLSGPPGIGKSHLAHRAARVAGRAGLIVAYRAAMEVDRTAPLFSLAGALAKADVPELAWLRGERPEQSTPERLGRVLDDLAADRPLLVIVDDAQWMDEFSVLAVRTLVPRLASSAVRWLFVRRPGTGGAAGDALDDLVTLGAEEIVVGPLAEADVERLCAECVGVPVDATVLAQADRCGGNPLWITSLLAGMRAEGQLAVVGGRATLRGGDVPTSFIGAAQQRLRGMPPEARLLLRAGSVFARPFRLGEAAALLAQSEESLWAFAEDDVTDGMLVPAGDAFAFEHDMLREVVYNTIPGPLRDGLHRKAAAVISASGGLPTEVADHLMKAGPATAADQAELLRTAAAGIAALAPGAAANLYLHAVGGFGPLDPRRAAFTAEAVPLLASAGRLDEARRHGEAAFRSGLDATTAARLCLGLAEACKHAGRNDEAVDYTSRGLSRGGVAPDVRARLCAVRAHALFYEGELSEADRAGAEAHTIGADPGAAVFGLTARSLVAAAQGRLADALAHARTAVALADDAGGEAVHRHPQIWLGSALTMVDRPDEAERVLRAGRAESTLLGTGWSGPLWHYYEAGLLAARGDLPDAIGTAAAGVELAEQQAVWQLTVPLLGTLIRLSLLRGDPAGARGYAEKMRERTRTGITAAPEDVLWPEALLAWQEDGPEPAVSHLRPLYQQIEDRPVLIGQDPGAAAVLVRIAIAAGRTELAEAVVRAARALAGRNPDLPSLAGAAAHAEGLLRGDVTLLREAVGRFRQGPRRLALAAALDDLAALDKKPGAAAEAAELREACGAAAVPRQRRNGSRTDLTPTELRVAAQVARGRRNREIAAELFVSPHTVDTHLRHIYAKLNINNRPALATWYTNHHVNT
ncbi:helix-turn-helix transcriptional regulator [Catenuloplanes indicus]|uniref:DNA-binding CsgD family transcriptional regulator n=1 Tax=Catenuloplanes indicus TaxID=137267 RepID=A0AAE3W4G9_9ACTN|nr:LuxR family transcriptional regulator [Catenuloplanes indicus]MDQ0369748.1 DNA-binding CsgD family transcriptional regulator [Catenuloplanes indicus]